MSKRAQKELNRKLNAANKIVRETVRKIDGPVRKSHIALIRRLARTHVGADPSKHA